MYFLCPVISKNKLFTIILFQIFLFDLACLFISLLRFLIFMPVFSSPFLARCSTHSFLHLCSSIFLSFYTCISFLPMHFSFCPLIYFSIFIIHHLPVNFLSPQPSLHPCLLEVNISLVQFATISHFILLFSICTYPMCIAEHSIYLFDFTHLNLPV